LRNTKGKKLGHNDSAETGVTNRVNAVSSRVAPFSSPRTRLLHPCQRIAIAAAAFMRCSFVMRQCFAGVRASKEQRHEAEEGQEIEEVSPV
jgi:hypothetical protein